jgi:hypothetical protein
VKHPQYYYWYEQHYNPVQGLEHFSHCWLPTSPFESRWMGLEQMPSPYNQTVKLSIELLDLFLLRSIEWDWKREMLVEGVE